MYYYYYYYYYSRTACRIVLQSRSTARVGGSGLATDEETHRDECPHHEAGAQVAKNEPSFDHQLPSQHEEEVDEEQHDQATDGDSVRGTGRLSRPDPATTRWGIQRPVPDHRGPQPSEDPTELPATRHGRHTGCCAQPDQPFS